MPEAHSAVTPQLPATTTFIDLKLSEPLIRALHDVGYESPSPIQAATIPILLSNRDVLGTPNYATSVGAGAHARIGDTSR
jgi:superfamily II DNA/RNA helicase